MSSGAPLFSSPAGREFLACRNSTRRNALAWRILVVALTGTVLLLTLIWPPPALGLSPSGPGEQLFVNHCAGCHVHGGNIIRRGRTLRLEALKRNGLADPAAIAAVAASGRGQMSAYGEVLGPGGPEAVAAWVWEQAQAGWPRS